MRRTRIALVVTALLLATTSIVRAQHSVGRMDAACGCGACTQCGGTEASCPSLLSSVTQGVHHVLSSVFCCPGLDARHDIYRAALDRNDFGKCNRWFLPIYSCRKCSCGPAVTGCPHCGQGHVLGEEVIDMQQVPDGVSIEPTPATEPTPAVESTPIMEPTPAVESATPAAPKEARSRHPSHGRAAAGRSATPTTSTKQTRSTASRDRVARSESGDKAPQPVQPTTARRTAKPKSLIQRTSLLQLFQSSDPSNPSRE